MNISSKIDDLLMDRGESRRAFAISIGIPPSTFQSAMERGNMKTDMLRQVAEALNVSIVELLDLEDIGSGFNEKEASDEVVTKVAENIISRQEKKEPQSSAKTLLQYYAKLALEGVRYKTPPQIDLAGVNDEELQLCKKIIELPPEQAERLTQLVKIYLDSVDAANKD